MVKLRDDLVGVVYLNGHAYSAGDEIPDGVRVGGHLTEDGKDHGHLMPEPPKAVTAGDRIPLTEAEAIEATALGLQLDGDPEWVRGALAGHLLGVAAQPQSEPLSDEEAAYAEKLGMPTDIHPERIRGAIVGYEQGSADTLAAAARGTAFDPSDAGVEVVQQYIAANPTEAPAVLALEAAGKARKGILGEYLA